MLDRNNALTQRVIKLTALVFLGAGSAFTILLMLEPVVAPARVVINFMVAVLGLIMLLLVRRGRLQLAAQFAIWCMFVIVSLSVWRNGGLLAPNILLYPVLLVLSGWLLGTRSTLWLSGLLSISLFVFFYADQLGLLPNLPVVSSQLYFMFILLIIFSTTALTLISRNGYQKQLEEAEKSTMALSVKDAELVKLSRAIEQSPDSIFITNLKAEIEYVNNAFVAHTGYSRLEALGKNPRMLRSGNTPRGIYEDLWFTLTLGKPWRGELMNRRKDGSDVIEMASIAPIRQADGRISHYVAVEQDITQVRQAEDKIYRLTNYDNLTGLPNRTLLTERIEKVLLIARKNLRFCTLIVFNIDRFKNINDARGRAMGDTFLIAMSERISALLQPEDTLARLSADEFAILLHESGTSREQVSGRAMVVVKKIQDSLFMPFKFPQGDVLAVTASIGVTLCPDGQNDSVQDVLRRADTALHGAKQGGGARIAFFDAAMTATAEHRFLIERELRNAIPAGELRLYLQPQVDAEGRRVGAEALVRWQHPERGLLAPGVFIQIAEESDLIIDLDMWVMGEVCRLIAQEEAVGMSLDISVNISPRHFHHPDFVSRIVNILTTTGADASRLTLEITEGLLIEGINDVVIKMNALNSRGMHFSIDDFGTGYSSLAYLKRLPIHELKIDKTFIQDVPHDADDVALVETILAVAKHMHLKVVAEGVETEEQAAFLNVRGKVVHQGYLFGRPEVAQAWLERWRSAGR